jgi:hypothetical protein
VKRAKSLAASLCLVGLGVVGTASSASAASVIYSATTTNLTNMTHQNAYTWQLEGINLGNNTITQAVLTFNGFFNWNSAANDPTNILWVDLLDTSTHTGNGTTASMTDNNNGGTLGINDVLDAFRFPNAGQTQGTNVSVVGTTPTTGLVGSTTNKIYFGSSENTADASVTGYNASPGTLGNNKGLANVSSTGAFNTTPVTWSITVTNSTVLNALASYISNGGNIAFGLDSDCHFGDSSIQFQIYGTSNVTQAAVPEPGTMLLVGSGLFAAYRRRRKLSA